MPCSHPAAAAGGGAVGTPGLQHSQPSAPPPKHLHPHNYSLGLHVSTLPYVSRVNIALTTSWWLLPGAGQEARLEGYIVGSFRLLAENVGYY